MHLLDKVKLILLSPCHIIVENVCITSFRTCTSFLVHSLYYLYAHTYRIARRSDSVEIRDCGRGPAGDPVAGGFRRRRIGVGRTT
jgi:hypothetical protein